MSEVLNSILRHVRPCAESEIIDDMLGPLREAAARREVPVVLFCAGSSGRILHTLLSRHHIPTACFCDNEPSMTGAVVCGLPVISFDELKSRHRDSLIVIASAAYQKFVTRQLLENGFGAERIVSLDGEDGSWDGVLRRERLRMYARNGDPVKVLEDLRRHEDRISEAFRLFDDPKSRELFIRRLALVASGYEYNSYRHFLDTFSEPVLRFGYESPERFTAGGSYFYFTNDVFRLREDEVLVDGGAYDGDSAAEFVRACARRRVSYRHIYCFEPDPGNYQRLCANTSGYRHVTCFRFGLWSHRSAQRFVSSGRIDAFGARIQEGGRPADTLIETAGIDELLPDEAVSLIKMDVEGAETEALRGAETAIRKHKPRLAVSVYHRTSDLYDLPLLVHRMLPDSKLYLRHFGNYFDDTMLLATE